jgi:hypothetical protein
MININITTKIITIKVKIIGIIIIKIITIIREIIIML